MLANGLDNILNNFDFTDSIVTEVRWADNLVDLVVVVDYYWDIQEGRDTTRLLKIVFKNCSKADFQIEAEPPLNPDVVNRDSIFTIVLFRERLGNQIDLVGKKCVDIFTTSYSKPWLSVGCSDVMLEETSYPS